MAKITIDLIDKELSEKKWKILSSNYTNLSTEMHFLCPEGHDVFTSWEKLRKKCECPVCEQNTLKRNEPIIIEKKKNKTRVLGLDQASHKTGWSIFDGAELVKYGVFETNNSSNEIERFHQIKIWLISIINNWKPDLVAIEGIQYQANVNMGVTTFQSLARLQGILMELCYELNIPCEVCATNTWRAHCGVKGRSRVDKKKSMQLIVKNNFDITVSDDEADAIGIGKYASETHKSQTEIVQWE